MARKDFVYIQDVSVENLRLDTSNARIRTGEDDVDCIHKILKQESQFLTLFKDIVEKGLSTIPVLVEPIGGNEYKVWDGNRRVAALKLINNPRLCHDARVRGVIQEITSDLNLEEFEFIDCLSSYNKDSLVEEVVLRHSGALDGKGQQNWNAFLRTVFLVGRKLPADDKRAAQYLLWAEDNGIVIEDDFPITSVTRLFNKDNIRILGFEVVDDELVLSKNKSKALLAASKLVTEFYTRRVRVEDVFTPEKASGYVVNIAQAAGLLSEEPQQAANINNNSDTVNSVSKPSSSREAPDPPQTTTQEDGVKSPDPQPKPGSQPSRGRGTTKPSWDRNGLFYRKKHGLTVPQDKAKIQTIVNELTRLKVDGQNGTPTAVAVLFRALIELCVDHYNSKNKISKPDEVFHKKVAKVADDLKHRDIIDTELYSVVISRSRDDNGILNVRTLHKYVHSSASHANKQVLNSLWDELGEFLAACLRS